MGEFRVLVMVLKTSCGGNQIGWKLEVENGLLEQWRKQGLVNCARGVTSEKVRRGGER